MEKKIIQVNESEYNSILRQVVAVIENSKATIAKNINIGINTTHWNTTVKKARWIFCFSIVAFIASWLWI